MSPGGSDHVVPGSAAGIVFQLDRALHWLARSPYGAKIGIETEDDVAVQLADSHLVREQDKHSVKATGQPFTDRSPDLWKTLGIWADAVANGEADVANTTFFLATNREVPRRCLAWRIHEADSDPAADACIADLKSIGDAPSDELRALCAGVLGHSDDLLRSLIRVTHCIDSASSIASPEGRRELAGLLQIPRHIDAERVIDSLAGWVQRTAMADWRARRPAWISKDAFANQCHATMDSLRRERQRERRADLLPVTQKDIDQARGRLFVRQMELITQNGEEIIRAARDFIRSGIECIRLSKEGDIPEEEWAAFSSRLRDRWEVIRDSITRLSRAEEPRDVGYSIYDRTTAEHREPLAGQPTVERYLTAGTYQRLADDLLVGWHPSFRDLLQTKE